jgi:hypothetical protein
MVLPGSAPPHQKMRCPVTGYTPENIHGLTHVAASASSRSSLPEDAPSFRYFGQNLVFFIDFRRARNCWGRGSAAEIWVDEIRVVVIRRQWRLEDHTVHKSAELC